MFDQILQMVKDHFNTNPQVANNIPAAQADEVHQEIASQVNNGLKNQVSSEGGISGLLSSLQNGMSSGSPVTSAIEGGLVSSLANKFGLPPSVTGAISGMLPGLLQKFANKANDPNDSSITPESISHSFLGGNNSTSGLSSLLGKL